MEAGAWQGRQGLGEGGAEVVSDSSFPIFPLISWNRLLPLLLFHAIPHTAAVTTGTADFTTRPRPSSSSPSSRLAIILGPAARVCDRLRGYDCDNDGDCDRFLPALLARVWQ